MQAIPIPDDAVWEGALHRTIAPPDGDMLNDRIRGCDALIDMDDLGPCFSMLCELDQGDLEKLQKHGRFWLSIHTSGLPPFGFTVVDDGDPGAKV